MAEVKEQYSKEVQDWFDSGPVKPDTLELWLDLIRQTKDK